MTTPPPLHTQAADMLERYGRVNGVMHCEVSMLIAELRAAAALDELVRENERLGLYETPAASEPQPVAPKRDREADRARFSDPAFNRWLDECISDAGHTVWDQIESVIDAWHGWDNRQFYATSQADPPSGSTRIFSICPALVAADVIAGALYDFLGYLTTRDETLCMGATQECSPVIPALQAWAKTRNLPLDEANVKGWRDSIAASSASPRTLTDDGKLWSFLRNVMAQGIDIRADHDQYEMFSARMDAAAAERVDQLRAMLSATPDQP